MAELLYLMEEKGRGVRQNETRQTDRQEGQNKTQPQGHASSIFLPPATLPPTVPWNQLGREQLAQETMGTFPTVLASSYAERPSSSTALGMFLLATRLLCAELQGQGHSISAQDTHGFLLFPGFRYGN